MSYRPQIKKSDGTMQDLPLDAETIKGQEVKGLAFKDTIKNDDIANDAAIAQSKVTGLSASLSAKIDKSGGELKDTVVTFDDVSGMAANISSGETAKTLFGKIKNWFGRLKTLAFKDTIKNADIAGDADIAQHKIDGLRTDYVASLSVSGKTVTYKNKNGVSLGTITTRDTTYGNATQLAAGLMSAADKEKLDGIEQGANKYTLPVASSSELGGVKVGYTKNGDNYPVQLSSSGQMFVTVSGGGGDNGHSYGCPVYCSLETSTIIYVRESDGEAFRGYISCKFTIYTTRPENETKITLDDFLEYLSYVNDIGNLYHNTPGFIPCSGAFTCTDGKDLAIILTGMNFGSTDSIIFEGVLNDMTETANTGASERTRMVEFNVPTIDITYFVGVPVPQPPI